MTTMSMPGFNAEASVYKTRGHYRTTAGSLRAKSSAALTLAMDTSTFRETIIDCKDFPDNITCRECNNSGPGTLDCCQLFKRGDSCIIMNDPNAMSVPNMPTSWLPTTPTIRLFGAADVRDIPRSVRRSSAALR